MYKEIYKENCFELLNGETGSEHSEKKNRQGISQTPTTTAVLYSSELYILGSAAYCQPVEKYNLYINGGGEEVGVDG